MPRERLEKLRERQSQCNLPTPWHGARRPNQTDTYHVIARAEAMRFVVTSFSNAIVGNKVESRGV
jgi:hypothetical protein